MLPALHLAGVHSVGNGLLRRAVQAGGRFGGGSRGECWLVCLLTFLFYVCQVYCWLVEESRGGYLYRPGCIWGRDGERPGIWDKRLGGCCVIFWVFFCVGCFGLRSCFQPVLLTFGGCADAPTVNIHAMSCGKDLDSGWIG